jgi:hypothetical protein
MNKQMTLIILYIIFSTLALAASSEPVFSEKGMVVSTSRQASEAGIEILKKGGNAIDAAVTVGFMAFPPFFKISIPASEACLLVETTIPFSLNTGSELAARANVEKIMYKIISVICLFIIRV